ncbi:MAG: xanthine dehydrogenase family protein molybdopterin-binding subunit [Actinomycetota bacterium]
MSSLGKRVLRTEDPTLLTVGGRYVDDLDLDAALHAVFVRSTVAHAELGPIHIADAAAAPGVVAVFTAADLGLLPRPPALAALNQDMAWSSLATDRVRYVGEPYAVVVAESLAAAVDAAERVYADLQVLPAVVTTAHAQEGNTLLYPNAGTNVTFADPSRAAEDFFDDCDVTVSLSFTNSRIAPCPLEPRATSASWDRLGDGREHLTLWTSTQNVHGTRDGLVDALGVAPDQIRVACPDVGGGFGAKNGAFPEDIVVAMVARRLGRPVRWAETRSECMLGLVHGRGCSYEATIGGTSDGRVTAYQVHVTQDAGAHPAIGAYLPSIGRLVASGSYDIAKVDYSSTSYVTNTVSIGAYRGAGRPEAALAIERMIDAFAAELGMDPLAVRRRNFIPAEAFPVTTPTGAVMDVGEYETALDSVIDAADYAALREEQSRRRTDPTAPLLGLGWSTYVAIANAAETPEYGSIEIEPDGLAIVRTGSSDHGQGHFTVFAQIASDLTGIPRERIEVRRGDTDEVPRGGGTSSSKSLQIGGSAVFRASEAIVARARAFAAELLEASPDDVVLDAAGSFSVIGTPAVSVAWADVAAAAIAANVPLHEEVDFVPGGRTFPFGTHLSVVEVDRDTGLVSILRHIACDDAGTIVNPMLFEGQVHGANTAGLAQAMLEEFRYDDDGNPLTSNFMDYTIPTAAELPSFELVTQETPRLRNPLGVSGIGEAGCSGATPALQNAVVDALSHLGVRHVDIPATPERVWRAIAEASR